MGSFIFTSTSADGMGGNEGSVGCGTKSPGLIVVSIVAPPAPGMGMLMDIAGPFADTDPSELTLDVPFI
ncbi:MAG: hypothetical protein ABI660_22955 [Polaromonas sp.]